jgi:phosphoglycolate phosphatase
VLSTLVLWDVDGTLVRAGDVGADVFDDAVEEVLGRRPPRRIHMSGKTDPQIIGEYLELLEEPDRPATVDAICAALARHLARAEPRLAGEGHACPGAEAVLRELAGADGVVSTCLTGNIAPNARVKLGAYGLDRWLDLEVGAYGSDDRDRDRLVPIALGRVAERYGGDVGPGEVWVVGDTPRDLACAQAGGARCLLVATGRSTADELRRLEPDVVLEDLADTETVLEVLLAGRRDAARTGR